MFIFDTEILKMPPKTAEKTEITLFVFDIQNASERLKNKVTQYAALLEKHFSIVLEDDSNGNKTLNIKEKKNSDFIILTDLTNQNLRLCHKNYPDLPIAININGELTLEDKNFGQLIDTLDTIKKHTFKFEYEQLSANKSLQDNVLSFLKLIKPHLSDNNITRENTDTKVIWSINVAESDFIVYNRNEVLYLSYEKIRYPLAKIDENGIHLEQDNIQLLRKHFANFIFFELEDPESSISKKFVLLLQNELDSPDKLQKMNNSNAYILDANNTDFSISSIYDNNGNYSSSKFLVYKNHQAPLAEVQNGKFILIAENIENFIPSLFYFSKKLPSGSEFINFLRQKFCLENKVFYKNGQWQFNTSGTDFTIRTLPNGDQQLIFKNGSIFPIAAEGTESFVNFSLLEATCQEQDNYRLYTTSDLVAHGLTSSLPENEQDTFQKRALLWKKTREALQYYAQIRLEENKPTYRNTGGRFFECLGARTQQEKLESVEKLFRGAPLCQRDIETLVSRYFGGILRGYLLDTIRDANHNWKLYDISENTLTIEQHLFPALGYSWNNDTQSFSIPDSETAKLESDHDIENSQNKGTKYDLLQQNDHDDPNEMNTPPLILKHESAKETAPRSPLSRALYWLRSPFRSYQPTSNTTSSRSPSPVYLG